MSTSYIVTNELVQQACSHLCDEGVGHLGKEPTDTFIPHWIVRRTYSNAVMALSTSHSLLTERLETFATLGATMAEFTASDVLGI